MAQPRLPIAPHLSPDAIHRRYRACRTGVEKTHGQILWRLTRGPTPPAPAAVAAQLGLTAAWVRTVLRRWNAEGPAGLADRRPATNGGRPKRADEQHAALFEALQGRPDDGGLWTGPKVAADVRTRWGVAVCNPTGWGWLRGLGFTPRCPGRRPRRPPRSRSSGPGKDARDRWGAALRHQHPDQRVEVWAEDEARLGLKPIVRRAWSLKGRRPAAQGRTQYQWLDVYAFVHPASGRNLELILPAANTDGRELALAEVVRWADPAGGKLLVVLVDHAGGHVAKRLTVPPNVVLRRRPPCTPELQPAEPLWPRVREAVANRGFDSLEARDPVLVGRCQWLIDRPEVVRGAVGFDWAAALNG
jgi:transposase